ncbi:hypothetical protein JKP88DRAFT_244875 [Tribonema minus]|uniref:Uncharacterized protein n=1 Tax=Tribonema minus TaxID=303371 RepID=A0A835YZ13_9STRA|nr:hypothetical protein JKP88DRAFT_244875 [Tribonema minus]
MERPYPELYKGDPNKAILRDFPDYYADAVKGCIYSIRTVDHIDNKKPDCHLLSNLRWATKREQRANQKKRSRQMAKERPIIVTASNGESTVYSTSNEWLKAMGRSTKLGSNQQNIRIAIRKGTGVFGAAKVEWWLPSDTGEFAPIQPAFINGAVGYSVSQFGGWVKLPTGKLSQGHKRYDTRHTIGIGNKSYLVYRLVASAHLAPPDDPTKTMVNHIDGNASNSDYTWNGSRQARISGTRKLQGSAPTRDQFTCTPSHGQRYGLSRRLQRLWSLRGAATRKQKTALLSDAA